MEAVTAISSPSVREQYKYNTCRASRPIPKIADDLRLEVAGPDLQQLERFCHRSRNSVRDTAPAVTIRRALDVLRTEGLVESRQGFRLGRRRRTPAPGTFRASPRSMPRLASAGVRSRRRILDFGFVSAPQRVRGLLGEGQVLEVEGCTSPTSNRWPG